MVVSFAGESVYSVGGAVGRDIDLSISVIQHTMKIFQASDGFPPLVGKPNAPDLWIPTMSNAGLYRIGIVIVVITRSASFCSA
jgi:hypothetical protein